MFQIPELDGEPDQRRNPEVKRRVRNKVFVILNRMSQYIRSFRDIVPTSEKERARIEYLPHFGVAWMYLVSGVTFCPRSFSPGSTWQDDMNQAERLIIDGLKYVLGGLSSHSLLRQAVVMPLDIVALLSRNLLHHSSMLPGDIMNTYGEHLTFLVSILRYFAK